MMPISDPRDRFFYPHHTPMKDTYNLKQLIPQSQFTRTTLRYLELTVSEYCMPFDFVVVVALLFYVHGKHLRSCRDGQLT